MLCYKWNSIQEWTTDRYWKKAMDFVSNVNVFDYTSGYHHQAIPPIVLDDCQSVIKTLHSRALTSCTLIHLHYKNPCLVHIPHPYALWTVDVAWEKLLESLPKVTNSVCTVHTLILNWMVIITIKRSNSAVLTLLCSCIHAETDDLQVLKNIVLGLD